MRLAFFTASVLALAAAPGRMGAPAAQSEFGPTTHAHRLAEFALAGRVSSRRGRRNNLRAALFIAFRCPPLPLFYQRIFDSTRHTETHTNYTRACAQGQSLAHACAHTHLRAPTRAPASARTDTHRSHTHVRTCAQARACGQVPKRADARACARVHTCECASVHAPPVACTHSKGLAR